MIRNVQVLPDGETPAEPSNSSDDIDTMFVFSVFVFLLLMLLFEGPMVSLRGGATSKLYIPGAMTKNVET